MHACMQSIPCCPYLSPTAETVPAQRPISPVIPKKHHCATHPCYDTSTAHSSARADGWCSHAENALLSSLKPQLQNHTKIGKPRQHTYLLTCAEQRCASPKNPRPVACNTPIKTGKQAIQQAQPEVKSAAACKQKSTSATHQGVIVTAHKNLHPR